MLASQQGNYVEPANIKESGSNILKASSSNHTGGGIKKDNLKEYIEVYDKEKRVNVILSDTFIKSKLTKFRLVDEIRNPDKSSSGSNPEFNNEILRSKAVQTILQATNMTHERTLASLYTHAYIQKLNIIKNYLDSSTTKAKAR
jgi:hypothetical protein